MTERQLRSAQKIECQLAGGGTDMQAPFELDDHALGVFFSASTEFDIDAKKVAPGGVGFTTAALGCAAAAGRGKVNPTLQRPREQRTERFDGADRRGRRAMTRRQHMRSASSATLTIRGLSR